MSYEINKEFAFCYAHRLYNYQGKCGRVHGHNARLIVTLADHLDAQGMVRDFTIISNIIKTWLDVDLDHFLLLHHTDELNAMLHRCGEPHKVLPFNPTAENLARYIFETIREQLQLPVIKITLYETDTASATYTQPNPPPQCPNS